MGSLTQYVNLGNLNGLELLLTIGVKVAPAGEDYVSTNTFLTLALDGLMAGALWHSASAACLV